MKNSSKQSSEKILYCSFCGKSQHEVKKLVAGPSVFICDECIELTVEIVDDVEGFSKIKRKITFPPEYVQAGISLLSNFSRVVRQKYPNIPVHVTIEQNGPDVEFIVRTSNVELERVKHTLVQYGLVLQGDLSPAIFLDNPNHVQELKSKLEIAALELRLTKEMHQQALSFNTQRIISLEDQVKQLHSYVGSGISQNNHAHQLLELLIKYKSNSTEIEHAVATIAKSVADSKADRTAEVTAALEVIKLQDAGLLANIKDIFKDIVSGVGASAATGWLGAVIAAFPK